MRRRLASRLREKVGNIWPILPGSEQPPDGWPGWPGGKKFAFVLTHDVESTVGLEKCRQLMELDMEFGFRSSFNFVPEGDYRVSREFREELAQNGFEVGIHDLRHDGRLYQSERGFKRNASRINQYLADWGSVGFRSAFMLHKLEWLHELNIDYDASTFDTDPFEPQPEGRHTIFPFWVPAPAAQRSDPPEDGFAVAKIRDQKSDGQMTEDGAPIVRHSTFDIRNRNGSADGYVELPYTLPQDSTLFVLLGERTPEIWLRKLDWIAEHGGMVLVDTHPDYMDFGSSPCRKTRYSSSIYEDFLAEVRSRYGETYWNALPREVAVYVKEKQLAANANGQAPIGGRLNAHLAGAGAILSVDGGNGSNLHSRRFRLAGRVVMLVENYFPQDTRVRNEALLLKSAGHEVAVVCYRKPDQPRREKFDGVNVYRISRFELFRKTPSGERSRLSLFWLRFRSLVGYLVEYFYFTAACFIHCARIFIKSGFDVIHAHNPPDTLFLVALPFKLLGKKFVFDHHDLCPELYQSRYSAEPGFYTNLLRAFEWCSLKLADVTVATNNSYKEIEIERGGVRPDRVFIVRNGPSCERMTSRVPFRASASAEQNHSLLRR